jgi:hypothetical protein
MPPSAATNAARAIFGACDICQSSRTGFRLVIVATGPNLRLQFGPSPRACRGMGRGEIDLFRYGHEARAAKSNRRACGRPESTNIKRNLEKIGLIQPQPSQKNRQNAAFCTPKGCDLKKRFHLHVLQMQLSRKTVPRYPAPPLYERRGPVGSHPGNLPG